jgi:leucyl/phenylalanyl-tRNA--protein transferase
MASDGPRNFAHSVVGQLLSHIVKANPTVLPRVALAARWCVFRTVGPVRTASWAARVARYASSFVGSFVSPTATDIVANYARGFVLFGIPLSVGVPFFWAWFPVRAVITPATAKLPKGLRSIQRRGDVEVRYDQDFEAIIHHTKRDDDGWLTSDLIDLYRHLQALGFVATVGAYREGRLVGGLWGIEVGRTFGIMSMFHLEDDAGALALAAVADVVADNGRWSLVDCGTPTAHFERYGAKGMPTEEFCELVLRGLKQAGSCGLSPDPPKNRAFRRLGSA